MKPPIDNWTRERAREALREEFRRVVDASPDNALLDEATAMALSLLSLESRRHWRPDAATLDLVVRTVTRAWRRSGDNPPATMAVALADSRRITQPPRFENEAGTESNEIMKVRQTLLADAIGCDVSAIPRLSIWLDAQPEPRYGDPGTEQAELHNPLLGGTRRHTWGFTKTVFRLWLAGVKVEEIGGRAVAEMQLRPGPLTQKIPDPATTTKHIGWMVAFLTSGGAILLAVLTWPFRRLRSWTAKTWYGVGFGTICVVAIIVALLFEFHRLHVERPDSPNSAIFSSAALRPDVFATVFPPPPPGLRLTERLYQTTFDPDSGCLAAASRIDGREDGNLRGLVRALEYGCMTSFWQSPTRSTQLITQPSRVGEIEFNCGTGWTTYPAAPEYFRVVIAGSTGALPDNVNELMDAAIKNTAVDTDFDGLPDFAENGFGAKVGVRDSDGDGLLDGIEVGYFHSMPGRPDTDSDGLADGTEAATGHALLWPDNFEQISQNETTMCRDYLAVYRWTYVSHVAHEERTRLSPLTDEPPCVRADAMPGTATRGEVQFFTRRMSAPGLVEVFVDRDEVFDYRGDPLNDPSHPCAEPIGFIPVEKSAAWSQLPLPVTAFRDPSARMELVRARDHFGVPRTEMVEGAVHLGDDARFVFAPSCPPVIR